MGLGEDVAYLLEKEDHGFGAGSVGVDGCVCLVLGCLLARASGL